MVVAGLVTSTSQSAAAAGEAGIITRLASAVPSVINTASFLRMGASQPRAAISRSPAGERGDGSMMAALPTLLPMRTRYWPPRRRPTTAGLITLAVVAGLLSPAAAEAAGPT